MIGVIVGVVWAIAQFTVIELLYRVSVNGFFHEFNAELHWVLGHSCQVGD